MEQALKSLGNNLRTARLRRNLTIATIAAKIGTGLRAVSEAEKGNPSTSDEAYIYKDDNTKKFKKYLDELSNYIEHNQELIINYNERHKYGETVSSAVAESTVNEIISKRMVEKQQMRWSQKGAHLLLQVRVKTLNNELKDYFAKWNPGMSVINDDSIWEKAA